MVEIEEYFRKMAMENKKISKKTKYRKKKKAASPKALTALKATKKVLESSESKQEISTLNSQKKSKKIKYINGTNGVELEIDGIPVKDMFRRMPNIPILKCPKFIPPKEPEIVPFWKRALTFLGISGNK